jgi:hypothetical protein
MEPYLTKLFNAKKKTLSIVLYVSKFQDDWINKQFLLRVNYESTKDILIKDVKNIFFLNKYLLDGKLSSLCLISALNT